MLEDIQANIGKLINFKTLAKMYSTQIIHYEVTGLDWNCVYFHLIGRMIAADTRPTGMRFTLHASFCWKESAANELVYSDLAILT